jgi:hypothetical protein
MVMSNHTHIIKHFEELGFTQLNGDANFDEIALAPSYLFEKDTAIKALVIRESSINLPLPIIQRFSESKRIPDRTLELFFVFLSKPTRTILRNCINFAVGIFYLNDQKEVEIYAESRQLKGRPLTGTIPRTQLFFSSRQHIEERILANEIVNDQRDSLRVPIFSMLVENDQQYSNDIRKLWPVICRCMNECQYVLVILTGEYRKIIDDETRRALEYYDPEDILFYIKNDKQTKDEWRNLITHVTSNNVKYTDYIDLRDFKLKFNQRLMKIIINLHEKNGVKFLTEVV